MSFRIFSTVSFIRWRNDLPRRMLTIPVQPTMNFTWQSMAEANLQQANGPCSIRWFQSFLCTTTVVGILALTWSLLKRLNATCWCALVLRCALTVMVGWTEYVRWSKTTARRCMAVGLSQRLVRISAQLHSGVHHRFSTLIRILLRLQTDITLNTANKALLDGV